MPPTDLIFIDFVFLDYLRLLTICPYASNSLKYTDSAKLFLDYKDFVMTITSTDKTALLNIKTVWEFKPCYKKTSCYSKTSDLNKDHSYWAR